MRKILLLFFYVFISITVFAQSDFRDGYIVTHENDTIYGEIALRSNLKNAQSCIFRNESDVKTYTPNEISTYRIIGEKYYISKEVDLSDKKETVFLEFLVEGTANLYYLKKGSDEFFILEKEGRLVSLTNKESIYEGKDGGTFAKNSSKFRGVMLYFFRDAPQLANKIKQVDFSYKPIIKIVTDYNKSICPNNECVRFEKSTKLNVFMEAVGGVAINKMGLEGSDEYLNSLSPTIGVDFVFKPSKAHYVWNVILGVSYQKLDFSGQIDDYDKIVGKYLDFDVQYSLLRFPLKVRYEFPGKKIQPFLSAGLTNSLLLNINSTILNQRSARTQREENAEMENYQFGYCASLGFKYKISDKNYLIFEAEYESRRPRTRSYKILSDHNVNSMMFSVGYAFKL